MKESELVSVMNNFFKNNRMVYANEIRMGIGIPDVMVGCFVPDEHENIMDYYALKMYFFLVDNSIRSINKVIEMSVFPRAHTVKYIRVLENRGILAIEDDIISISKRIQKQELGINVSIEAKIKDWKGGLFQAQRYLSFSDYSYVAIPEMAIDKVDQSRFSDSGIGLLAVSEESIYEVVKPSRSTECDALFKYISISSMLDKFDNDINSCRDNCELFSMV